MDDEKRNYQDAPDDATRPVGADDSAIADLPLDDDDGDDVRGGGAPGNFGDTPGLNGAR